MRIDFKDEAALKTLTRCLLKQDFNLSVNLPPKQLVPTLPLRLNYILWIEDFIETFKLKDVIGLDIGRFLRTAQVQLYITVHNPNMITDSTFDPQAVVHRAFTHCWQRDEIPTGVCLALN